MTHEEFCVLAERVLSGTATPEDRKRLEAALAADGALRGLWDEACAAQPGFDALRGVGVTSAPVVAEVFAPSAASQESNVAIYALFALAAVALAAVLYLTFGEVTPAGRVETPRFAAEDSVDLPAGGYIVAAAFDSEDGYDAAARRLCELREASLVRFDAAAPQALFDRVRECRPRYIAFVLRPEQIDINLVYALWRGAISLDEDPFLDVSYGLITGATPDDAVALAEAGSSSAPAPRSMASYGIVDPNLRLRVDADLQPWLTDFGSTRILQPMNAVTPEVMRAVESAGFVVLTGSGSPTGIDGGLGVDEVDAMTQVPKVVYAGQGYSGVTGLSFQPQRNGALKQISTKPADSFCLAWIRRGCAAMVGSLGGDYGRLAHGELQALLESGLPIGDAHRDFQNEWALLFQDAVLQDQTPGRIANDPRSQLFFQSAAARVLFGDPACRPLQAPGASPVVETEWDWETREGHIRFLQGEPFGKTNISGLGSGGNPCLRFYVTLPVPDGADVPAAFEAKVHGPDGELPVVFQRSAVETNLGGRFLHLWVGVLNRSEYYQGNVLKFDQFSVDISAQ